MSKESNQHGPSGGPRPGGFGPMGMAMPPQKAKNFKGTLSRLIGYLKPYKLQLFAVLLTAIISTVFSIVSPKIMGKATTKLFEGLMMKFKGIPGAKSAYTAMTASAGGTSSRPNQAAITMC